MHYVIFLPFICVLVSVTKEIHSLEAAVTQKPEMLLLQKGTLWPTHQSNEVQLINVYSVTRFHSNHMCPGGRDYEIPFWNYKHRLQSSPKGLTKLPKWHRNRANVRYLPDIFYLQMVLPERLYPSELFGFEVRTFSTTH